MLAGFAEHHNCQRGQGSRCQEEPHHQVGVVAGGRVLVVVHGSLVGIAGGILIAVILAILYVDRFTDILETLLANTQYDDVVQQFEYDDGTNLLRVLVYSVPPALALIGRKQIKKADNPIVNLSINMSIISMGIYIVSMFTSGIYIGRLPIYFSLYNYILLPWELDFLFTKRSSILLKIAMTSLYLIFCYYQMVVSWGYTW